MSTCATQHTAVWTCPPSLKQMPPERLKAITEGGDPQAALKMKTVIGTRPRIPPPAQISSHDQTLAAA
jgi:hypothetical protein